MATTSLDLKPKLVKDTQPGRWWALETTADNHALTEFTEVAFRQKEITFKVIATGVAAKIHIMVEPKYGFSVKSGEVEPPLPVRPGDIITTTISSWGF